MRRVDRVVQAEVDGELVLMSPKDYAYFGTEGLITTTIEIFDIPADFALPEPLAVLVSAPSESLLEAMSFPAALAAFLVC